jgi:SAM-dependent methyltransferase
MDLLKKWKACARSVKQTWGSTKVKRDLWNAEFSEGRWESIDHVSADCVYPYVEKYCCNGCILDLGCGSGNTGNELDLSKYKSYMGVDLSDVAIRQSIARSESNGRSKRNRYVVSDIATYTPIQKYDVILFRESIYYMSRHRIRAALNRYSHYLTDNGVFIVRLWDRGKHRKIVDLIEHNYAVVDRYQPDDSPTTILVFQPRT